ncbi:hypothetical protein Tco_1366858 [Tanacetum coccineum]
MLDINLRLHIIIDVDPTHETSCPLPNSLALLEEWIRVIVGKKLFIMIRKELHVFVGYMRYVMDFNSGKFEIILNPSLSNYEDDYDRGCRKPSDLEDGFYKDTIKLGPEYVTGMDDEGEVT